MPLDVDLINRHAQTIVGNLDAEAPSVYLFLKDEFGRSDCRHNLVFQFVFRAFYGMDSAGLSDEHKRRYFQLLEAERDAPAHDMRELTHGLYLIRDRRRRHCVHFSFVTKLLNMIDPSYPIYDRNVARAHDYTARATGTFDQRFDDLRRFYAGLRESYEQIVNGDTLAAALAAFADRFPDEFQHITSHRTLDFVVWSYGRLLGSGRLPI